MTTGLLIAIEGIDGAGKTTQARKLTDFFRLVEESIIASKEPTDGPWGRKIRESARNGRMSLDQELEAFIEDRKEHVRDLIAPALANGKIVLLDRYFYSTLAYQGARGADVTKVGAYMRQIAPEPEVVFLIDVPPEVGLSRISRGRGETPNSFETLESLETVRAQFLALATQTPTLVAINGTQDAASVFRAIVGTLVEGALKRRWCAKPWGCDGMYCVDRIVGTCRWAEVMRQVPG